jgi:hypothetical protein
LQARCGKLGGRTSRFVAGIAVIGADAHGRAGASSGDAAFAAASFAGSAGAGPIVNVIVAGPGAGSDRGDG